MRHAEGLPGFDRARILDAATRARVKKKRRLAISLYRWLLAVEPRNGELHARLAPLLAETNQQFDAWVSYRAVAKACLRTGQSEKALAVFREAARMLPREVEAWWSIARLQRKAGRNAEAIDALIEGSRQFRPRLLRPQAIYLLRRAREIDPWNYEAVLELGRLLATSEQRPEARLLLAGLAERCEGHRLRAVRAAQLRVTPGPRHLWLWLRSLLGGEEAEPEEPARRSAPPPPAGVVSLRSRMAQR